MNFTTRIALVAAFVVTGLSAREALSQSAPRQPSRPSVAPSAAPATARSTAHVVRRVTNGRPDTAGHCIATVGCPAPRAIPVCTATPTSLTINQLWDQRMQLQGRTVTLRSRLDGGAACTERACSNLCCNSCTGGHLFLENPSDARAHVRLGADDDPLLACSGDDSGLCCGTEVPTGPALVTGTLVPIPNSGGDWRIENPTLCRLP